jgi:hypothetical protein
VGETPLDLEKFAAKVKKSGWTKVGAPLNPRCWLPAT